MLKTTIILVLCLISIGVRAQEEKWDRATLKKAQTTKQSNYLSKVEKEVIYYSNLARLNPQLFEKTFLEAYIKKNGMEPNKWIRSARLALRKTKPMDVLTPKEDLYKAAKKHAIDMGRTGKIGHKTSRGKSFDVRMKSLYMSYELVYENCNYGLVDGFSIVCDFLIDLDVPDAGHRKTLLNAQLKYIGTSVEYHKEYLINCVQDFGG